MFLDERPLTTQFEGFKKDGEVSYGHYNLSIPTIAVCDFLWPAIKSLQRFDMETVPTYLQRSTNIWTGKATDQDFCKLCFIQFA